MCKKIYSHKFQGEYCYKTLFNLFLTIFDYQDIKEFNNKCDEFEIFFVVTKNKKFSPMNVERLMNHLFDHQKVIRLKDKHTHKRKMIAPEIIRQELDNLVRWCYKRLNEYYLMYGVDIEGVDISETNNL